MASFDYADLVDEGMLGFTPSPAFQPPVQQQPALSSPSQSGYSTPNRGRGGRRGFGPRGGRGGAGAYNSGTSSPASAFAGRGRGRGGGIGAVAAFGGAGGPRGGFGGRGRGSPYPGSSTPRGGGVVGMGGVPNPFLVPVKFVKASSAGLGTVGGEDEHGLEKAGAEVPQPWQVKPIETVDNAGDDSTELADGVSKLGLTGEAAKVSSPPRAVPHEPEPYTTVTMALDEIEDADEPAVSTAHPGLGVHPAPPSEEPAPSPLKPTLPSAIADSTSTEPSTAEDDFPLFEISTTRSEVTVEISSTLPPPAALAAHAEEASLSLSAGESDSESDEEQILYPPRAVSHADPVLSRCALPPSADSPAPPSSTLPPARTAPSRQPAAKQQPPPPQLKQSKKQLKKASRAARKAGRQHARSGRSHLSFFGAGQTLGGFEEDEEHLEEVQDKEDGKALFARLNSGGGAGIDDMLVDDGEEERTSSDEEHLHEPQHEDGQPRIGDSDLEWGDDGAPPPRRGLGAHGAVRGKGKRAVQRQQRADQREVEKLERLVAVGATREEVEVSLAIEESLRIEMEEKERVRRAGRKEQDERRRLEDYLANVGDEEGDDSIAVMSAFAKGVVGSLGGEHERGDDVDRRAAEDEDDEDAWGTSEGSEEDSSEEESKDEDESSEEDSKELDEEEEYERRLALESEDSDEVDSDVELEMEYSLGNADGRVEHSLSLASTSAENTSFDSSLSSSTDSAVEQHAFEAALLSGRPVRISRIGQEGGGGRKAERERKKEKKRLRKGKGKVLKFVEQGDSEEDEDELFAGKDSWAERDEDFVERMQRTIIENGDLLETAAGGKNARRSNRKERNKLFKAISEGNFDDFDAAASDIYDDDEIDAMLLGEEEEFGWGGGSSSKKQRKKDKTFEGAFSASLAAQWETDRQKKAKKKAERAAVRAAQLEAETRDAHRYSSKSGGKKGKSSAAFEPINDAATVNIRIRHFILYDLSTSTLSLPPMSKKARIAVHLLAEVYGLKSRSLGSGKARFPVLERTSRTTVANVSERRVRAIVGTADGENEIEEGYERWGGLGRGGRGGKMVGLWKALEGADGKKKGGRSGGAFGKNSEGAVVGQGADKLGAENIGFALLKKMGWTEGGQIGLSGGLSEPVVARVKTNKQGLGSGYAVSRREAQELARAPENEW
ncbi:hypothetical protein JCM8547_004818 [Rhodosporidiobolus lusitaniae]